MSPCTRCQNDVAPGSERCPHCGAWLSPPAAAPAPSQEPWKDAVRSLLDQGRKIEAIRLYREQTGVGLAAAKSAVERMERGESDAGENPSAGDDLQHQVLDLLAEGKMIAAVKLYRERTSLGLKEAKDAVEALAARHGIAPATGSGCLGLLAMLLAELSVLAVACSS